jgi:hypothetical protein
VRSIQTARARHRTYRETELGEPLASVLADLRRDRASNAFGWRALPGDVATLIAAGSAVPTHYAHASPRTESNPFFIEEVLAI